MAKVNKKRVRRRTKAKTPATARSDKAAATPPRYIVVHRGPGESVLDASDVFEDEDAGTDRAATLLGRINFFAGDSLTCEPYTDQDKELAKG